MKLPDDFISKIIRSLQEEEVDIYTMTLYLLNSDDMNFFGEKDRKQVRRIFKILTADTKRHSELLKLIVDMGSR